MIRRETTVLHIVENSILFHLRPLRHPDIIDAVHHLGIRFEAVVSTFRTITRLLAQVIRVQQQTVGNLLDTSDQQFGGFPACYLPLMVVMGIEKIEHLATLLIAKLTPGTNTVAASSIPALARNIRCFGKPEIPLVQQIETTSLIEDS